MKSKNSVSQKNTKEKHLKMMVPQVLWQGFTDDADKLEIELKSETETNIKCKKYRFTSDVRDDGRIRVAVLVYEGSNDSNKVLLIVPGYDRIIQEEIVTDLVLSGYTVVIPDLSGQYEDKTEYPESLAFCGKSTDRTRFNMIIDTPRNTPQYIYATIIRKTYLFINKILPYSSIVLVGMDEAVEVAVQAEGSCFLTKAETGKEPPVSIKALACLNGAGYREYLGSNRWGEEINLELPQERMLWLSSIASVAYARHISKPVFIGIGTNSHRVDMDRLETFTKQLNTKDVIVTFSEATADFLLLEAYESFKVWLSNIFSNAENPTQPVLSMHVNEAYKLYFYVRCDASAIIESVNIHFASTEFNHELRDWRYVKGIAVSFDEYIATPDYYDEETALFFYAEVIYASGLRACSFIRYIELSYFEDLLPGKNIPNPQIVVVYQISDGLEGIKEHTNQCILFKPAIRMIKTQKGIEGVITKHDILKTYRFNSSTLLDTHKVLQIDLASEHPEEVYIILQAKNAHGQAVSYSSFKEILDTNGLYRRFQFELSMFKDKDMMPLKSWANVKSVSVVGEDVIVGNMLFI